MNNLHAILVGLTEDLAGELVSRLRGCAVKTEKIERKQAGDTQTLLDAHADIIFCGAEADLVGYLRTIKPYSPIVVVSRHAEVSHWLDAIEAGATNYCAAPFETAEIKWLLESSIRFSRVKAAAAAA